MNDVPEETIRYVSIEESRAESSPEPIKPRQKAKAPTSDKSADAADTNKSDDGQSVSIPEED